MRVIDNQRGAAMLIGLAVLIMLSVIATAAIQTSVVDIGITDNLRQETRSFYLAEAGIEHGYSVLRDTSTWRTGLSDYSLSGGTYDVTVFDNGTLAGLDDTIMFISEGTRSGATTTLEVKLAPTRPFRWAAFADSAMDLNGDTYTDSYDSDSGTYAATKLLEDGDVGSNGSVDISGTAQVNGDAGSASEGQLEVDGAAQVNGDTTTSAPLQIFDPVSVADINAAKAGSAAPGGLSGTYNYNAGNKRITVNPGNTLTLAGGTYYFSEMDIRGAVAIAPGATVKIFTDGDITVNSMATMNAGGRPIQLQIYSRGDGITVNGGAEVRAVVYAPDTEIRLTGGGDLYGSYVGNVATDNGGSNFHYDRSLRDVELEKHYSKVSWREI